MARRTVNGPQEIEYATEEEGGQALRIERDLVYGLIFFRTFPYGMSVNLRQARCIADKLNQWVDEAEKGGE